MDRCNEARGAPETKVQHMNEQDMKGLEMTSSDARGQAASAYEAKAHEARMTETFEAFKSANDERLREIERKQHADVLLEEKVERLNREMDRMTTKAARPVLVGSERRDGMIAVEHKAAFESYARSGQADGLRMLEAKALNGAIAPDGGYLLPPDAEASILARMAALSPIRSIATVRPLANSSLKKAVYPNGANAGWAAQTNPSNTVTTNQYSELSFPTMELFAQPAATQTMLDDAAVDVESWIADEIVYSFSEAESTAFITGDGTNKPKGLLTYPTVDDSSWAWGSIGTVSTGVSANFPASSPSDILVDLAHALRSAYRQRASFVMNRKTQGAIRKFKDANGNYIWAPPTTIGAKATLMNFPVVEAEDMPDIAANSLSIAFGDFRRGYLVIDRVGIRALRDPYSSKPYVLFYTTKRVGGGVQDFEAIKLLKFGV
ncbi:MAG: HK97 family phage major capsid [Beijerinckiaceae bacterium]|nr:MAG: HK97 family phage major capsid [Beijerinckiaceae bacterium]